MSRSDPTLSTEITSNYITSLDTCSKLGIRVVHPLRRLSTWTDWRTRPRTFRIFAAGSCSMAFPTSKFLQCWVVTSSEHLRESGSSDDGASAEWLWTMFKHGETVVEPSRSLCGL